MNATAPPRRTTAELERVHAHTTERLTSFQQRVMRASIRELRKKGVGARALPVGAEAPDFILPDATGGQRRLYCQLKKGPVVLVFFRGGWCPFCETYLRGLQRELLYIHELGAELMAVSPQLPDVALHLGTERELAFPLVSDVGLVTARRYGLVYRVPPALARVQREMDIHLEELNGHTGADELPLAATFIIDRDHRITRAEINEDHTRRYDPVDILEALVELRERHRAR